MRKPQHKYPTVWTTERQDEFDNLYSALKLPLAQISTQMSISLVTLENRIKKLGMKRTDQ